MSASTPVAIYSAPGKALLAGGYLVLFTEYSAFSVGLSSRMYAAVYPTTTASSSSELVVESPQFDSHWNFPSKTGTHRNSFLEACYDTVTSFFEQPVVGRIVIWSDNGFHSQRNANPAYFHQFSYHGKPITEVPKTGLGSSAALVSAVVPAMAKLITQDKPELSIEQLHNLAQIAHCQAQQKVGSGFDVATAIHGTIIYSRFNPKEIPSNGVDLKSAVTKHWEMTAEPSALPANIAVVMGDIAQGSETPGMVKNVLKWKEANPGLASEVFETLNKANMALAASFSAKIPDAKSISSAITEVRLNLQRLTSLSGVPIEPPKQTKLLEAASEVSGVLGGVVPGAGGDDAVCVLVDLTQSPIDQILTDLARIEGVTWMPLELESRGLVHEPVSKFV